MMSTVSRGGLSNEYGEIVVEKRARERERERENILQASSDDRSANSEDMATFDTVVHGNPAAVPSYEGPDGEGDGVAADGDALGEPLTQAEFDGILERVREHAHGAQLGDGGVGSAHGGDSLLRDGAGLLVLITDILRQVHEYPGIHDARYDEKQEGGEGNQREPPHHDEPDGVAADKQRYVLHEVGHLQ
ncbi:hypothetical protein BHE74_00058198 [Ensete ventricosum]|nr:hypothetical protein BHE74_00058198 [Ensete ventricosum]